MFKHLKNFSSVKKDFNFQFKSPCNCKKKYNIVLHKCENDDYSVNQVNTQSGKMRHLYNISAQEFNSISLTCNLYNALRRGKSQKVIGFSLYGNDPFYYKKLANLTKMVKDFYPGWLMRVYIDKSVNKSIICDIECQKDADGLIDNSDFCFIENMNLKLNNLETKFNASYIHAMKWRWFPIGDSFVDLFMSRDTDNLILMREVNAVKEWIKLKKTAHIMRGKYKTKLLIKWKRFKLRIVENYYFLFLDHPEHGTTILGGMWGFQNKYDRNLANKIFGLIINSNIAKHYNSNLKSPKEKDQNFLSDHVYKLLLKSYVTHDSYSCNRFEKGKAFPDKRLGDCYVGNPFSCDPLKEVFHKCPKECRPPDHLDWENC